MTKRKKTAKAAKKTTKKAAGKTPAAKKAPAATKAPTAKPKPAAQPARPAGASAGGPAQRATYAPQPLQGTGWAPFRYPPQ